MAVSQISLGFISGAKLFADTDNAEVAVAVSTSPCTVYELEIDNTLNAAQAEYVKLCDTAGAVNVGTTVPDYVFRIPAAVKRSIVLPDGLSFAAGLAIYTVQGAALASAVAPTSNVTVKIVYA